MKLATRINSYFRSGDRNLDRVFAQFEEGLGLTRGDSNYPGTWVPCRLSR